MQVTDEHYKYRNKLEIYLSIQYNYMDYIIITYATGRRRITNR
jgi:hypothetical protein